MKQLLFLFAILLFCVQSKFSPGVTYTAHVDTNDKWTITLGKDGVATAVLYNKLNHTGWWTLDVVTNSKERDDVQAYGAGYIEGALTQLTTYQAWKAFNETTELTVPASVLTGFIQTQNNWIRTQVKSNLNDPYWIHVGLVLAQFDGLVDGYSAYAPEDQKISWLDLLMYQLSSELGDIMQHFATSDAVKKPSIGAHCSVLIRVSNDGQRLFASHDTWSDFTGMLRIYKFYKLAFSAPQTNANSVSFSSYPSFLQSSDDFYMTNQDLVIMETTNEVFNQTLFTKFVVPQTVPFWIRIIVSNRMATNGKQWSEYFTRYNSGTYNNQYQVVDYKLFTPGKPVQPNTLWIAEQIPGFVVSEDKSNFLVDQKFWPSYNIPYFPFIYNMSGYPANFKQYGDEFSYSKCARAQIFARDAGKVQTLQDMKRIMRYNDFQNDPLSLKDACKSISARCDLNVPWSGETLNGYSAFGGLDSKVTDNTMLKEFLAHAVCGPTWDDQPPFAWNMKWASDPSYGMPTVFAFDYIDMKPTLF